MSIYSQIDSVYLNAYNYILNSNDYLEIYNDKQNIKRNVLCVSPTLTTQSPIFFVEEIIKEEYDTLPKNGKDSIETNIRKSYNLNGQLTGNTDSSLAKINEIADCKQIVFFSIYENKKIFALVLKNIPGNKEYSKLLLNNIVTIRYLFYFDANNFFTKSFSKIGYR